MSFCFLCCKLDRPMKSKTSYLEVVTYEQFEKFVNATKYKTDAEKYGWSIVQQDVFSFVTKEGADWRRPDGNKKPASKKLPVTQVSYNDVIAYCDWSGTRIPDYDEYWELIADDDRKVITNSNAPISKADRVNVLGNVWEITSTEKEEEIRLAGGSLFCSPALCHGTSKDRELYVDKETGNIHIGFAVVK